MKHKFLIKKEDLYKLFIIQNKTRDWIASFYGCSSVLIKKKCQEFDIKKPKNLENENKERKLEKICQHCKNIFKVVPSRYEGRWEIKFCSHKCSSDYRYLGANHKRKMLNNVAANRRAYMRDALVDLTKEEKERTMKMYIECPKGYEVDHIIPISKGGKHHPDNLQYLTISENRKKSNKCSDQ
jgi:hypothetical protein